LTGIKELFHRCKQMYWCEGWLHWLVCLCQLCTNSNCKTFSLPLVIL